MTIHRLAALVAAALLACAPAAAQVDVRTLPVPATLGGNERTASVQGAGCPTRTAPCASVAITPDLLRSYLNAAFQAKDADLDAIAALSTQPFGRGLLAQADAASVRSAIGTSGTGADTSYAFRANNLSDLANAATARANLGLGSIATQPAGGVAITGGTVAGIVDLALADGGTGASTAAAARSNLGLATVAATGLDTDLLGAAWTTYTPSLSCLSGTLSSASASGRWKRVGKAVFVQVRIAITTNGSCATAPVFGLPAAVVGTGASNVLFVLAGREDAATGLMLQAALTAGQSTAPIFTANNAYPGGDGRVLIVSGSYEAP